VELISLLAGVQRKFWETSPEQVTKFVGQVVILTTEDIYEILDSSTQLSIRIAAKARGKTGKAEGASNVSYWHDLAATLLCNYFTAALSYAPSTKRTSITLNIHHSTSRKAWS
jgi:hypothetical protein